MPLHLLGKKSWNVYSAENIARVQRDEAAARAREEAEEQRMQEVDAKRRLAILRGETPPPLPLAEDEETSADRATSSTRRDRDFVPGGGRKRKRAGEDDTDFEMRLARERAETGERATRELAGNSQPKKEEISLVDSTGHISLFQPPPIPSSSVRGTEKNADAERESSKKKRELEDQYRMRFINAATGPGKDGRDRNGPWYAAPDGDASSALVLPSKNVFGEDDPGRKFREVARIDSSDPLAMMKMGAAKVRQLEKERRRVNEEREEELKTLRREERRGEKKRRRERDGSERDRDRHSRSERRDHSKSRHRSQERSRERRYSCDPERGRNKERERDRERRHRGDGHRRRRHHSKERSSKSEDDHWDRHRRPDRERHDHRH